VTAPLFTRPDPNLAEVRWLLRELRAAGWRHGSVWVSPQWTEHEWCRGDDILLVTRSSQTGALVDDVTLSVDREVVASVSVAWIERVGVFAAHDLGVALGVFSDLETQRHDHQLLASLIHHGAPTVEARAWLEHRLEKDARRPGRVDDVDGMLERLLARRGQVTS
jgi:hypothetical protein